MLPAVNATNRWQGIEFTLPLICSGIEYKVYMCRTASISTLYVRMARFTCKPATRRCSSKTGWPANPALVAQQN